VRLRVAGFAGDRQEKRVALATLFRNNAIGWG
jgi:hypothetical protein